jgi:nucleotide-binding universal stress UspA family protein
MVYRTILAPLDGSEFAEHALTTAAHLAATAKAPLLLARVHQSPSHLGPTWDDFFRNEERGYLERVAARVAQTQRIDVETAPLDGDVVDAIRECAEQRAECLIVMTTNGRTGISRAWFGSVADGIVRNGTRPVLMLRPQGPARPSMTPTIRHVIVALDGSPLAEQAVGHAAQLALMLPASMTLLRVIEPAYPVMPGYPGDYDPTIAERLMQDLQRSATDYLEEIAAGIRRDHPTIDVQIDLHVADAAAPAIIERACAGERAFVALATRGRGLSRLIIGSVADKVIRAAGDGVLVIRPVGVTS